jgi:hypothetical protein
MAIPICWWWMHCKEHFDNFESSPWAQGYELLRRLPEFHELLSGTILGLHSSPISFELNPMHRPWIALSISEQERFKFTFAELLAELGFQVSGGVVAGNRGIIFKCLWPRQRIIAWVKGALNQPTPPAVEVVESGKPEFAWKVDWPKIVKTAAQWKNRGRLYVHQERISWQVVDLKRPEWILFRVPQQVEDDGKARQLTRQETLTTLRSFLRNPPMGYLDHVQNCRETSKQRQCGRLDHPVPKTLMFGLMCYDTTQAGGRVAALAEWLARTTDLLGRHSLDYFFRALRHGKKRLRTLLHEARKYTE